MPGVSDLVDVWYPALPVHSKSAESRLRFHPALLVQSTSAGSQALLHPVLLVLDFNHGMITVNFRWDSKHSDVAECRDTSRCR